jgi:hypothetical protein
MKPTALAGLVIVATVETLGLAELPFVLTAEEAETGRGFAADTPWRFPPESIIPISVELVGAVAPLSPVDALEETDVVVGYRMY